MLCSFREMNQLTGNTTASTDNAAPIGMLVLASIEVEDAVITTAAVVVPRMNTGFGIMRFVWVGLTSG